MHSCHHTNALSGELAKALEASEKPRVIVNTVNPGFCDTDLWRNAPWPLKSILSFSAYYVGRTKEMGSRILMWAVFAGDESQGKYSSDCTIREPCNFIISDEGHIVGRKVYNEVLAYLELAMPSVSKNI